MGNRGIGGNLFAWKKIRTSGNPGKFGRMGNSGASGDTGNLVVRGLRRIGKNRYMWQQCETMLGLTHGKTTNWEIGDLGDSGDWELRESGRFGKPGNSGIWELREIRKNHYMWEKKPLKTLKDSGYSEIG